MNKEFTPIILAEDFEAEQRIRRQASEKLKICQWYEDTLKAVGIDVKPKEAEEIGFLNYAIREIRKGHPHFEMVSDSTLLELFGISHNELTKQWHKFKSIKVDLNDHWTEPIIEDTTIYIESETEKERFDIYLDMVNIVKRLNAQGMVVNINDLNKVLRVFDKRNPIGMKPNLNWVKGNLIF